MRQLIRYLTLFLALISSSATAWGTVKVVVPRDYTNLEGSSLTAFPFDLGKLWVADQRYQQVYASSEFPAGTWIVTQLRFRPDANHGFAFQQNLPKIRIALSATPATTATLNYNPDKNFGLSRTIVYDGVLPLSSTFSGPAAGPKAFDIVIDLMTPFIYNPAEGNLLMEVLNALPPDYPTGIGEVGLSTTWFDAVPASTVTVTGIYDLIRSVYSQFRCLHCPGRIGHTIPADHTRILCHRRC